MRKIKFRVWDKRDKKMRQLVNMVFNTGFYLEPNDNTLKLIWVKGYNIIQQKDIQIQREKDFELMQYTGLHDKNGKEIYEGDIVKVDADKAVVKYSDDCSGFILKEIGEYYFDNPMLAYNMDLDLEVIGNVWENSDLLDN